MTGPVDFHDLSWAAGVLDARGRFLCLRKGEEVRSTRVFARVGTEVARRLAAVLGGRVSGEGWTVPAGEQEQILQQMIPYLRVTVKEARNVLAFRLTSPTRMLGWGVSHAVRAFRGRIGS